MEFTFVAIFQNNPNPSVIQHIIENAKDIVEVSPFEDTFLRLCEIPQ
jgi:hypothetical protein